MARRSQRIAAREAENQRLRARFQAISAAQEKYEMAFEAAKEEDLEKVEAGRERDLELEARLETIEAAEKRMSLAFDAAEEEDSDEREAARERYFKAINEYLTCLDASWKEINDRMDRADYEREMLEKRISMLEDRDS
jgi:hypothetical protein